MILTKTAGRTGNKSTLQFNANANTYAKITNYALTPSSDFLSISFWAYTMFLSTSQTFISSGHQNITSPYLWVWRNINTNSLLVQGTNGSTRITATSVNFFDSESKWVKITLIINFSTGGLVIYKNNGYVLNIPFAILKPIINPEVPYILLGAYDSTRHKLIGNMFDMQVYDRELYSNEIELQNQGLPISRSNMMVHWKMNEGDGNSLNDYSGNNIQGACIGLDWTTDKPF